MDNTISTSQGNPHSSDQKTEKATDLCIKMHHNAPPQAKAMAWKTNLPVFDCLKLSIYTIKAHMAQNYGVLFKKKKNSCVLCD